MRASSPARRSDAGIAVNVLDAEAGLLRACAGRQERHLSRVIERADYLDRDEPLRRQGGHASLPRTRAGLRVPAQESVGELPQAEAFRTAPRRGRQTGSRRAGAGISVDIRDRESLRAAIQQARRHCESVLWRNSFTGHGPAHHRDRRQSRSRRHAQAATHPGDRQGKYPAA